MFAAGAAGSRRMRPNALTRSHNSTSWIGCPPGRGCASQVVRHADSAVAISPPLFQQARRVLLRTRTASTRSCRGIFDGLHLVLPRQQPPATRFPPECWPSPGNPQRRRPPSGPATRPDAQETGRRSADRNLGDLHLVLAYQIQKQVQRAAKNIELNTKSIFVLRRRTKNVQPPAIIYNPTNTLVYRSTR